MADVNIEKIVIGFLEANKTTGWEVYGDIPKERPDSFIIVDRTGGPRENIVQDRAEILIEVYQKKSRETASEEAYRIADIVPALVEIEAIMSVKINSVVKLDDIIGQYWRYQVYCDIYYRRGAAVGTIVYPVIPSGTVVRSVVAGSNITVDATDPENPIVSALDDGTQTYDEFVYNSSGTQEGNRFNDWEDLYAALHGQAGQTRITFEQNETLPAGSYSLDDVILSGNGTSPNLGGIVVILPDGFNVTSWRNGKIEDGLGLFYQGSDPLLTYDGLGGFTLGVGSLMASTQASIFHLEPTATFITKFELGAGIFNQGYEPYTLSAGAKSYNLVIGSSVIIPDNVFRGEVNDNDGLILLDVPDGMFDDSRTDANLTGTIGVAPTGVAKYINFDNSTNGFSATQVQAAIEEAATMGGSGIVESVIAGTNVTVDDTDPANPIVSATGEELPIGNMVIIGTFSMGSMNIQFYDGRPSVSIGSYTASEGEVLMIRTAGTADLGSGTPLTLAVGDMIVWDTNGFATWKILYTSLAGILDPGSNGILARTALNTTAARTITGTSNQVIVTDGDGVSGNPTLALPQNIHTGASPTFAGATLAGLLNSQSIFPSLNNSYNIGSTSFRYSSAWLNRVYLNATAYLDGNTGGTANLTGQLGILATSGAATHSLTLGSGTTGIALYNTSDQTTNYERARLYATATGIFLIAEKAGTGSIRPINIGQGSAKIILDDFQMLNNQPVSITSVQLVANKPNILTNGSQTQSSGTNPFLSLAPTINQSGTAGYTALLVNPTETATGSGNKNLADFQVGGSSKVSISNTGQIAIASAGIRATGLIERSSYLYAQVLVLTTGTSIERDFADSNPSLVVHQKHASSTGDILQLKNNSATKVKVSQTGDVEITDYTKGLILTASDASRWRVTVETDGSLKTTSI